MVTRDRIGPGIRWLSTRVMRSYLASGVRIRVDGIELLPRHGGASWLPTTPAHSMAGCYCA